MTDCQLQDPCSSCFFSLLDYQLLGWHLCVSSFCVTGEGHNWLAHWTCSFIEEGKTLILVSLGSPSRGGDVTVYVSDINHPSLPTLFVLFLCLFLSLCPFQLYFIPQILPTTLCFLTLFSWSLFCLTGPINYNYLFIKVSFSPPSWLTGLKAPTN